MTTETMQIEVPDFRRKKNLNTETVARKIPTVHKKKTQNRYYRIATKS